MLWCFNISYMCSMHRKDRMDSTTLAVQTEITLRRLRGVCGQRLRCGSCGGRVDLGCRICVKSLKIEGMRGRRLGKEEHFWDDDRCVEINTNDLVWCHVSSYAAEYNLFWCASVIFSLESLSSKKWYQMVDQFYCTSPILPAHLSGAFEGFGIAISRWQDGQQNGGNA